MFACLSLRWSPCWYSENLFTFLLFVVSNLVLLINSFRFNFISYSPPFYPYIHLSIFYMTFMLLVTLNHFFDACKPSTYACCVTQLFDPLSWETFVACNFFLAKYTCNILLKLLYACLYALFKTLLVTYKKKKFSLTTLSRETSECHRHC